jgi:hypothetical protein
MTTTCLDINACPADKMYNVICNFSIGYNEYACNPKTTCMRQDGKYDCCAKNIVGCVVDANTLRVPTIQPSIAIIATYCNQMCTNGNKIDKCYWYESIRSDNMCVENNNEYCCSQHRSDCCITNKTTAYIAFGSIAGIMIIITVAYYWYYMKNSRNKIEPAKDITVVEPPDRYKMINNL